jgi:uncharacterized membrane protein
MQEPEVLEFALMVFEHPEGAERAYSRAPREVAGVNWAQEIAFVEHRRHDRIAVRGTFAGHYVDADDDEHFIGAKTAEGAIGGAVVGLLFGPPGVAVGLVGGGLAGSVSEERSGPHLRSALFDKVRSEVPQGSSAVILFAPSEHIDAMIAALDGHGGRAVRHPLTAEAAQALAAAVADSPSASPAPTAPSAPSAPTPPAPPPDQPDSVAT